MHFVTCLLVFFYLKYLLSNHQSVIRNPHLDPFAEEVQSFSQYLLELVTPQAPLLGHQSHDQTSYILRWDGGMQQVSLVMLPVFWNPATTVSKQVEWMTIWSLCPVGPPDCAGSTTQTNIPSSTSVTKTDNISKVKNPHTLVLFATSYPSNSYVNFPYEEKNLEEYTEKALKQAFIHSFFCPSWPLNS